MFLFLSRKLNQLVVMFYRRYRQSMSHFDSPNTTWYEGVSENTQCLSVADFSSQTGKPFLQTGPTIEKQHTGKRCKKNSSLAKLKKVSESPHSSPTLKHEATSLSDNCILQKVSKTKQKKSPGQALISADRLTELSLANQRQIPVEKLTEAMKKLPLLVAIKPINEKSERDRFMRASYNYNPYFAYRGYADEIDRYKHPSDKYIDQAKLIMDRAIEHFGCYETFEEETGGKILSKSQIYNLVKRYLSSEDLEEEIVINLRDDLLSRGSMTRSKGKSVLNVRCVNLRESWAEGLLRHEIGTHYLRSCNTRHQPWQSHRVRRELGMGPINPTEEGLASLHSVLFREKPYLWRAALLYYTSYMASKLSFKDLFHDLSQYVRNPDVRWDYCLRAKRGQVDTSRPGSFSKDQVYLEGALQLLKRRRVLDFHLLVRLGKVAWQDVERSSVVEIAQLDKTRIPWFMDDLNMYRKQLDWIAKTNGLTNAVLKVID